MTSRNSGSDSGKAVDEKDVDMFECDCGSACDDRIHMGELGKIEVCNRKKLFKSGDRGKEAYSGSTKEIEIGPNTRGLR